MTYNKFPQSQKDFNELTEIGQLDNGEPKDIDETKLAKLEKLAFESKILPLKLFIIGKKRYLQIYKGHISAGSNLYEFGVIVPRKLERGEILDSFSKIEFLINEIIQARILGNNNSSECLWLDSLNLKIDLAQKIHILRNEWKVIGEYTFQRLMELKNVRNIIAHSWHFDNANYGKKQTLKTNFKQFQEDIRKVWKNLIVVYENLQQQDKLMDKSILELEKIKKEQEKNEQNK